MRKAQVIEREHFSYFTFRISYFVFRISYFSFFLFLLLPLSSFAAPGTITPHIKIDQFGYLPNSRKIAVIVDPQTGYNSAESFSPGTGANNYQVRRWSDDAVMLSGTLTVWNGGATQAQSGDRGWHFDFSALTTPGSYYIYDVARNAGSYRFEIGTNVYSEVLKHAVRVFFYQRINHAKLVPYADSKWADGAAFEGATQDRFARSRYDKTNAATAKDLHGGWMDAGDYNKYTSFTFAPLCSMLETYRLYPTVFSDNYNIPESGNGIPDLLDEIKWELDWLKRMQDATGTNGLFLKVGVDNYNSVSPPSADGNPRYWIGECTSATLTGAAVFALASIVYKSLGTPAMTAYGNDLLARAEAAWARANTTTSGFTSFQTTCDDQDIKAGDADAGIADQRDRAITAAAYLYEATGNTQYRTSFDALYTQAQPYANWWWGPYYTAVQRAMLRYARLAGATPLVSSNIISMKSNQNGVMSITDYNNKTDLYLAHLPNDQYHWGSAQVKGDAAVHNWDFVSFNINTANHTAYKETAEMYLHWFHGVNPMGKVLLSNMYASGGDDCANEIYHAWFGNGTVWDNAVTSTYGPPPGYVQGGPNKNYAVTGVTPPYGQPAQKAYKDWNTVWNGSYSEESWEITEPAIYYQAAYIGILARVMGNQPPVTLPVKFRSINAQKTADGALIQWQIYADEAISHFEIQRVSGNMFTTIGTSQTNIQQQYRFTDSVAILLGGKQQYRVIAVKANRGLEYSSIVQVDLGGLGFTMAPNPAVNSIYIGTELKQKSEVLLSIYDMQGRKLMEHQWLAPAGMNNRQINISNLLPGIYTVAIEAENRIQKFRLLKK